MALLGAFGCGSDGAESDVVSFDGTIFLDTAGADTGDAADATVAVDTTADTVVAADTAGAEDATADAAGVEDAAADAVPDVDVSDGAGAEVGDDAGGDSLGDARDTTDGVAMVAVP